jgi:UDP-hydrolysing UDP-N-acetyl-D-glucosamine 2-epimerase
LKRRLAVLTSGRQDWGILRSTCRLLLADPQFDLQLLVGGMHCSAQFGDTQRLIEEEGFPVAERLPWIPDDGAASAFDQAGGAVRTVGAALQRCDPEALVLVGDRFETAAAALAATLARVPIVHLHGGEETEGAFDNALRHAVTKMSHLHLVSHPEHARRVVALGEDPSAVHVVGAPGLDNLHRADLADRRELEAWLGTALAPPVVLVTLHPATLGGDPRREAEAVRDAMDAVEATYIITLPNSDPGWEPIRAILTAAAARPRQVAVEALGERRFWGLLRLTDALLGNSSGALIEAPALGVPAVNVGDRQKNRLRGANVLDAPAEAPALARALRTALGAAFRAKARIAPSPFGDGRSGPRIVEILRQWQPPRPPVKRRLEVIVVKAPAESDSSYQGLEARP